MSSLALNAPIDLPMLSKQAFAQIRHFFHRESGIHIQDHKQQLVIHRLQGHLQALGFSDFDQYSTYLTRHASAIERQQVIDLLTTNETYFFREPEHFKDLANTILPSLGNRPLRIWCAASSSGEEPYSLAMVLADQLGINGNWELIASDLSSRVLERAKSGLYPMQRMDQMPAQYLRQYCRKGVGEYDGMLRVVPELRERVNFCAHNLLDSAAHLGQFDIIFVRNVLIYFEKAVKCSVLQNITSQLRPDGWLVTSHSESLLGCDTQLKPQKPSLYRKNP